jgi:hypothetical protein
MNFGRSSRPSPQPSPDSPSRDGRPHGRPMGRGGATAPRIPSPAGRRWPAQAGRMRAGGALILCPVGAASAETVGSRLCRPSTMLRMVPLPRKAGEGDRAKRGGGGRSRSTPQPAERSRRRHHRSGGRLRALERASHNALSSEPCVLSSVTFRPIGRVVAHPIDLNRKPSSAAVEVEHVRPNRMLAAKDRRPRRASPQPPP